MYSSKAEGPNTFIGLEALSCLQKMLLTGNWLSQAAQFFHAIQTQQAYSYPFVSFLRTSAPQHRNPTSPGPSLPTNEPQQVLQADDAVSSPVSTSSEDGNSFLTSSSPSSLAAEGTTSGLPNFNELESCIHDRQCLAEPCLISIFADEPQFLNTRPTSRSQAHTKLRMTCFGTSLD
jgi:hypothetical protein